MAITALAGAPMYLKGKTMQSEPVVNVAQLIETRPIGRMQYLVIALSSVVMLFDGLDLQCIGLAAPVMRQALNIPPAVFGAVFSAALAGLTIGALTFGLVADRLGRKPVLVVSALCFGIFTVCTLFATGLNELLVYRFLTGLGLGGAMPSYIALVSEYVPKRKRPTYVSLVYAGFPIGGVIGGLVASHVIDAFGWQSVFWIGGVPAIILALVLFAVLPESLSFLVHRNAPADQVERTLRRVFPDVQTGPETRFVAGEQASSSATAGSLFTEGRGRGTVLLWISYFVAFGMLVTNSAWSPSLFRSVDVNVSQAAISMAVFNFGSLFGTASAGLLVARYGALAVLPVTFVLSSLAMMLIGQVAPSVPLIVVLEGLFGLFIGCASSGLIALAAVFYPLNIRSTGSGWAMALGRFGSFLGPLVVGALVGMQWAIESVFVAIGAPALVAAITSVFIARNMAIKPAHSTNRTTL